MSKLPWITKTKGTYSNNKFYHSMQWRNLRNTYIREYPLCAECERQNKTTLGTVVDHIIPIRIGGDKLSLDNLQTLCTSCHNSKSAKEKT